MADYPNRYRYAYARCTPEEYALVQEQAGRAGLTVSDYVRRGINSLILEESDDQGLLLQEHEITPRRRRAS